MSARVSVVIPAFDEAANIARTVRSVFEHVPARALAEVVVCDHGSGDGTRELAAAAGAQVHVWHDGTIAAQRNRGAELTTGEVLLFLDADTTLTAEWAEAIGEVLDRFDRGDALVTGSHPAPPRGGGLLARHWFANLSHGASSRHLGSAHLLIGRRTFDAIGGFDASLRTGEDFDLCVRATESGATVAADPRLLAIHHDFPATLRDFVRREAWHGIGNFQSWQMVRASPVAMATVLFAGLHLAVPVLALVSPRRLGLPIATIAALCAASSAAKFRRAPASTIAINSGIFYFYYLGRSLALARALRARLRSLIPPAAGEAPTA